jgi:hypothetical protein
VGIAEDDDCPRCKRPEDHDKWFCDDCGEHAWVGDPCYCCEQTEAEQEEGAA